MAHELDFNSPSGEGAVVNDLEDNFQELAALIYGERR